MEPDLESFDDSRLNRLDIETVIEHAVLDYFAEEVYSKEFCPVLLVGCGTAGAELAGIFRLKPDFVSHYLPENYPVRAIAMDTQANISERLKRRIGWYEPGAQLVLEAPPEGYIEALLEQAGAPQFVEPLETFRGLRSGGDPSAIRGRAIGLYHFGFDSELRRINMEKLVRTRHLSRDGQGYMLTFSSLDGGTGSGVVPVVAGYLQEMLSPPPYATLNICVTKSVNNWQKYGQLQNFLCGLYYLATSPINCGTILCDNFLLEAQGHKDMTSIGRYLQDVLMPVFLLPQAKYAPNRQPHRARRIFSPFPGSGYDRQEFIAACYSICSFPGGKNMLGMEQQAVAADSATGVPEFRDMLETALSNPTIQCQTNTARRVLAVLSGPPDKLDRMVPGDDNYFYEMIRDMIRKRCSVGDSDASVRFGVDAFPGMKDVSLSVLLFAPDMPVVEQALKEALEDPEWGPESDESLSVALRRVDEPTIREIGLSYSGFR